MPEYKKAFVVGNKNDSRTRTITNFVGGVGSGKEFAVVSGSALDFDVDTVNTKNGTESVKVISTPGTSKIFGTGTIFNRNLDAFKSAYFSFFISNIHAIGGVRFYCYDASGTNGYSFSCDNIKEGWNLVSLNRAHFTNVGTPTGWNNITRFDFRVNNSSELNGYVSFDSLVFSEPENTESIVNIGIDDAFGSIMTVAIPILNLYGFKANIFVTPTFIGTPNHLTVSDLQTLKNSGHELSLHGYNHTDYSSLTLSKIRADIDKSIDWMESNGLGTPKTMAFPGGAAITKNAEDVIKERFLLCRGTSNMPAWSPFDSIPFGYPYQLRGYGMSAGASTINNSLDLMSSNRAVMCLYSHDITEEGGSPATKISDFQSIMAKINTLGFEVRTLSQIASIYQRSVYNG